MFAQIVDLSGWRAKIAEEMTSNDEDGEVEVGLVHQVNIFYFNFQNSLLIFPKLFKF